MPTRIDGSRPPSTPTPVAPEETARPSQAPAPAPAPAEAKKAEGWGAKGAAPAPAPAKNDSFTHSAKAGYDSSTGTYGASANATYAQQGQWGTMPGTKPANVPTGQTGLQVGLDGVNAHFGREGKAGVSGQTQGQVSNQYGTAGYSGQYSAGVDGRVDAHGKLDTSGLNASINARAGGNATASISGQAETKPMHLGGMDVTGRMQGTASVTAGANAEATGTVHVGRDGNAVLEGQAGASAVLRAEAKGTASAGPFSVSGGVYGSVGAEAKAGGSIGYENGKFHMNANIGAALGLGGGANVGVQVDVKGIQDAAMDGVKRIWGGGATQ